MFLDLVALHIRCSALCYICYCGPGQFGDINQERNKLLTAERVKRLIPTLVVLHSSHTTLQS